MKKTLTQEDIVEIRNIMAKLGQILETGVLLTNHLGIYKFFKDIKEETFTSSFIMSFPLEEEELKKIPIQTVDSTATNNPKIEKAGETGKIVASEV